MKILVANLGSTSFKFRLFDMQGELKLARGAVERIGSPESKAFVEVAEQRQDLTLHAPDHAVALRWSLEQLTQLGCLLSMSDLAAIGFKAVHAQGLSGVQLVTDAVLDAMQAFNNVAPAHNPPYVQAMRLLSAQFPEIPLVAAFETGFHQTIPQGNRYYAIPLEWSTQYGILRYGFHGASHRYISTRIAEILMRQDLRIISCHLGGSSSLCAIHAGKSIACSLGMSPQSGLPHNNRVGDFDIFALPIILQSTGLTLEKVLEKLASQAGLFGISGFNDLRDIEAAATKGDPKARLALDIFVSSVRHYLGAYLVALGGADVIVFTGGIGENSVQMRAEICANLHELGIQLDSDSNNRAKGEMAIHSADSRIQIWTMPTNEEIIVARLTYDLIRGGK